MGYSRATECLGVPILDRQFGGAMFYVNDAECCTVGLVAGKYSRHKNDKSYDNVLRSFVCLFVFKRMW